MILGEFKNTVLSVVSFFFKYIYKNDLWTDETPIVSRKESKYDV